MKWTTPGIPPGEIGARTARTTLAAPPIPVGDVDGGRHFDNLQATLAQLVLQDGESPGSNYVLRRTDIEDRHRRGNREKGPRGRGNPGLRSSLGGLREAGRVAEGAGAVVDLIPEVAEPRDLGADVVGALLLSWTLS